MALVVLSVRDLVDLFRFLELLLLILWLYHRIYHF